jgi:hypothetical protein
VERFFRAFVAGLREGQSKKSLHAGEALRVPRVLLIKSFLVLFFKKEPLSLRPQHVRETFGYDGSPYPES